MDIDNPHRHRFEKYQVSLFGRVLTREGLSQDYGESENKRSLHQYLIDVKKRFEQEGITDFLLYIPDRREENELGTITISCGLESRIFDYVVRSGSPMLMEHIRGIHWIRSAWHSASNFLRILLFFDCEPVVTQEALRITWHVPANTRVPPITSDWQMVREFRLGCTPTAHVPKRLNSTFQGLE
ncbi:hypothetical protein PROFUN_15532 [Planoprotostelium fungivorum]|uniref:Uncharacterized protein n=1 Tax=Planoprotostelium fungivorum TaxID=1890364 RepID=A0A2P6MUR9_9EUKA|nr:hypothetical protein PROFUN_15532 [Planoprotostelium fungivorum]